MVLTLLLLQFQRTNARLEETFFTIHWHISTYIPEQTVFYNIKARDVDYGINNDLQYSIVNSSFPEDFFQLKVDDSDDSMNVVNTKIIDLEKLDGYVYSITIQAAETEGEGCQVMTNQNTALHNIGLY